MATVADFQLANQGFDALGRALLQRKLAEDKDAEDLRRALLDRQLQDYRGKELELHKTDLESQRENRAAALEAQKQHYGATETHYKNVETQAQRAQATHLLQTLGQQVESGTIAPESATKLLQQHFDEISGDSPFKFSVEFQPPKAPTVSYTTNPASGAIHATYGRTIQPAGYDPTVAQPKAYKEITDAEGGKARVPLTDEEVAALKNPPPPPTPEQQATKDRLAAIEEEMRLHQRELAGGDEKYGLGNIIPGIGSRAKRLLELQGEMSRLKAWSGAPAPATATPPAGVPAVQPAGKSPADLIAEAQDAIKRGADPVRVRARLKQLGVDMP